MFGRSGLPATLPQCSPTNVPPDLTLRLALLRVLLVEDEPEMAAALAAALKNYDMVVDHIATLGDAEEAVSTNAYGAILLDRQLPDGDGLALVSKLRASGVSVPVIVLTARGELVDRVAGLDIGADDYLGKPFAVEELLARLRAVLRRRADLPSETIRLGRLSFDVATGKPVSTESHSICHAANCSCLRRCCDGWGAPSPGRRWSRPSTASTTKSSRTHWIPTFPAFAANCRKRSPRSRSTPFAVSAIS